MTISYVLVGYNSARWVPGCLRSILADAPAAHEIIFVDNASRDGTAELVRRDFPQVRLIENAENLGHCKATNQGMKAARGAFIMLLDTDTELQAGVTATLIDFLSAHPDVKVAAPRMLNADGSVQETARDFPSIVNALWGRQTLLARLFPNNRFTASYLRRENLTRTEPFPVGWVSAACMIFPRSTLETVGEWDEGYAGYWVDADWCRQVQDHGGPIYCVPGAKVWHFEQNRPGRKKSVARIRLFNKGAHRFYMKHHTLGRMDPRAIACSLMLSARTAIQLSLNLLARADGPEDPDICIRTPQPAGSPGGTSGNTGRHR